MKYYLRTIDSSDETWSIFNQRLHSVDIYLAQLDMQRGDIVLLFNGKQSPETESGVYAWGKTV